MAKSTSRFLALLRGINVGGKNVIAKHALADCFVDLGFENVRSYIQSGNILFRSSDTDLKELASKTTMMKLGSAPAYQHVTVRNHNTVYRLLQLFEEI